MMIRWLNNYFLSDDPDEIKPSDYVWWYGIFGGSIIGGIIVWVVTL